MIMIRSSVQVTTLLLETEDLRNRRAISKSHMERLRRTDDAREEARIALREARLECIDTPLDKV